jgi:hypothetical protein
MDRGDRASDRRGLRGVELQERNLGAVNKFVDHGAGAARLALRVFAHAGAGFAHKGRYSEGQTRAHPGAQGAQGSEVCRLFGLGTLVARNPGDEVSTLAIGQYRGVIVVVRSRAKGSCLDNVEAGHCRRGERG